MGEGTRYVVIGGSGAGMAAVQAIRELDSAGTVTVLSEEPDMPYFRPMIPLVVGGKKSVSELAMSGQGPYDQGNLDVLPATTVERIDPRDRNALLTNGKHISYDKLLIATGGRAVLPAGLEGCEAEGVSPLRTLGHAREMARRADSTKEAVVVGGGLLGLKAAFALLDRGLDVTLIEVREEVLPLLMEPEAGAYVRDALQRSGIHVMTGRTVERVSDGADGVEAVLLSDGRELPCQLVCIGVGVQPNVSLLEGSGVRLDKGVLTDAFTATNVPHVYAAGDVTATENPVTGERIVAGTWTHAVEMGRCAGKNMAGRPTPYPGTFGVLNAAQAGDMPFVSMGTVHTKGKNYEIREKAKKGAYRKLVFTPDRNRLVGVVLIGDISRAGLYRYLIREGRPVGSFKRQLVEHTLHSGYFLTR